MRRRLPWLEACPRLLVLTLAAAAPLADAAAGEPTALDGATYRIDAADHFRPVALHGPLTIEHRPVERFELRLTFGEAVAGFGRITSSTGRVHLLERRDRTLHVAVEGARNGAHHVVTAEAVRLAGGIVVPRVAVVLGVLMGDVSGDGALDDRELRAAIAAHGIESLRAVDDAAADPFVTSLPNMPPVLAGLADVVVASGVRSAPRPLQLRDDGLDPGLLSIAVASSDPGLVHPDDVEIDLAPAGDAPPTLTVRTDAPVGSSATMTVSLSDGASETSDTFVVSVRANTAPVARLRASALWGETPLTVTFSAAPTVDLDGDLASLAWKLGNATAEGASVTHTFVQPGDHVIRLRATDSANASDVVETIVTVVDGAYDPAGPVSEMEARRFLWQAAFGPTPEEVDFVVANGYEAWIDDQLAKLANLFSASLQEPLANLDGEIVSFEGYLDDYWIEGEDQLRQRMVFALSQIIVMNVKQLGAGADDRWTAVRPFGDHAFGNYRDLLADVTFTKAMANYLTYRDNRKANPDTGSFPDENYAREIQQLFTIGLWELHPDGTPVRDAAGARIPSYDNDDISTFARIFTGLRQQGSGDETWILPLEMRADWHDHGMKQLHDYPGAVPPGGIVPASDESAENGVLDVQMAIDNLFHHPNCPPFVSTLLIKRFTLSNPSPAYVERVAQVFEDNGFGVRGDLAAVVKAILLDREARDPAYRSHPGYGKRLEPLVAYYGYVRALDLEPDRPTQEFPYRYNVHPRDLGQQFMQPPSVFNFFLPDYAPSNTTLDDVGLVAPELQIHNGAIAVEAHDDFRKLLRQSELRRYADWLALAGVDAEALVDAAIDDIAHRAPTAETRARIIVALDELSDSAWEYNAPRFVAVLLGLSPEQMVLR